MMTTMWGVDVMAASMITIGIASATTRITGIHSLELKMFDFSENVWRRIEKDTEAKILSKKKFVL